MSITYAILPHGDEYCVAHMSRVRVVGGTGFQDAWVVDQICPTVQMAVAAQLDLVKQAMVRRRTIETDLRALDRKYAL